MRNNKNLFKIILCTLTVLIVMFALITSLNYFTSREREIIAYADTNDLYSVSFNLNGSSSVDQARLICSNTTCNIMMPNAYRDDGVVLGYSDNKKDTSAKYHIGELVKIKKDTVFYVISYKENKLIIDKNNVDYLEKDILTCKTYNKETSCNVSVPAYNKIGYENKGYSTSASSITGYIYAGNNYRLSKDAKLYPIYSVTNHLNPLNIRETLMIKDTFVEIEESCTSSIANRYLEYLNNIKKEMPFLLIGNKVTFIGSDLFSSIWGSGYAGMNYGPKGLRSVDIRCSSIPNNDYYGTMVHEMAHTWDFYYATKLNSNITSQNDVINLYNKYLEQDNRPFREYSYSNIYEFFADMVKYYYFKYQIQTDGYQDLTYPEDIKTVLEKYICIAENNYNKNKCQ